MSDECEGSPEDSKMKCLLLEPLKTAAKEARMDIVTLTQRVEYLGDHYYDRQKRAEERIAILETSWKSLIGRIEDVNTALEEYKSLFTKYEALATDIHSMSAKMDDLGRTVNQMNRENIQARELVQYEEGEIEKMILAQAEFQAKIIEMLGHIKVALGFETAEIAAQALKREKDTADMIARRQSSIITMLGTGQKIILFAVFAATMLIAAAGGGFATIELLKSYGLMGGG